MRVSDWSSDVCSSDLSRTCWYVVVELVRALGLIGDSVRRGDDQRLGQAIEKLSGLTLLATRLASDELWVLINLVEATARRFANNSLHSRVALLAERAPAYRLRMRSEEHTSELQSLMRISYAVFCLNKNKKTIQDQQNAYRS